MFRYRKIRLVLPAAVGLALLIVTFLALQVNVAHSQETDETKLEQERATAAEQSDFAANRPLPQLTEATIYPLFMGVDNPAIPAYTMDPSTNISATAFSGVDVWGAAYDPENALVYFNDGSTLYEWPIGGVVTPLGTIVDAGMNTLSFVSLAFYDGQLYGTRNIANEAIYAIDTDTLVATIHIDYIDGDLDIGGLAVDPRTGAFYGTNDDSTPYGPSLVHINSAGAATVITSYPMGQTDIDGLAISDGGIAYMIIDEPGSIYVYDLNADAYLAPLTNPWTTSEIFSGGTYIYAGDPEIDVDPTSLETMQPPDTEIVRQLTISNTGFADLDWEIEEEDGSPAPASCSPVDLPWVSTDPVSGTVPAGAGALVDVTFDASGLATGVYTGSLCVENNDPSNSWLRVPMTMTVAPPPSIVLTKTVGLDPAVCATGNSLETSAVPGGLAVTYCYEVTNTGAFTLSSHDLVDDRLGSILSGFPYDLAPGASVFLTSTAQITQTTVNSATWTAVITGAPPISATATATATVTVNHRLYFPFIASNSENSTVSTPPTPWTAPIITAGLLAMVATTRRKK